MRLKDRTAVVTGAASGIGKAIALRFAAEGAIVVIADLDETPREGGVTTVSAIEASGGRAVFCRCDVSRADDLTAAINMAVGLGGRLDVMVNNAAIGTDTPLLETSEADWERVMSVNAKGVFLGCREAVRRMVTQEPRGEVRGRIVNISSQHGMIRAPNDFAYGVGKATVVYMTRQIAGDYAEQGIVCNAVAPGKILTGKTGRAIAPEMLAYSQSRTPWPRLGRPEDVANAVLFLSSDEASYITGENLMVDGGWMAN
ncbi:putative short-chain dehydrogenase [alpha proteobacterium BAL199]|jgi:NAD(P)-dependent dehydrogenase (short-subunit alcohol dehydrogenase family)|nr:putative short-chain dehydrogenase [alpha proteobacterium BAL199]